MRSAIRERITNRVLALQWRWCGPFFPYLVKILPSQPYWPILENCSVLFASHFFSKKKQPIDHGWSWYWISKNKWGVNSTRNKKLMVVRLVSDRGTVFFLCSAPTWKRLSWKHPLKCPPRIVNHELFFSRRFPFRWLDFVAACNALKGKRRIDLRTWVCACVCVYVWVCGMWRCLSLDFGRKQWNHRPW